MATNTMDRPTNGWWIRLLALTAMVVLGPPAGGQEYEPPEQVPAELVEYSPFAVGGSARKVLPPLDCMHCRGPVPCIPCDVHRRGFLYYGTYPLDDDCLNGFRDCPGGDCGNLAAGLSRAWIHVHQRGARVLHAFRRTPTRGNHCQPGRCKR